MQHDVLIIGAGIIGLATAYKLLLKRPDIQIMLLEKENELAAHQSSHNSGVIHSGIYYKPGSLKAINCQAGYRELIDFAQTHRIPFEICGKVIVATKEIEKAQLDRIYKRGIANGLKGISKISAAQVNEIEPYVQAVEAIWVPQAGIINYRKVSEKYADLIGRAGGEVLLSEEVLDIQLLNGEAIVSTSKREFHSRLIINCAGLYSDKITSLTHPGHDIQILPFRGEYYELIPEREYLVNNLIYPVPNPHFPFLGVHFTRMITGGIEAGPNAVLAFKREGYSRWDIDAQELKEIISFPGFHQIAKRYWRTEIGELQRSFFKSAFVKALKQLIPEIASRDVVRGRSGVRAMACSKKGELIDDFLIVEQTGAINVINAPSPAATASLAIGESIAQKALKQLE